MPASITVANQPRRILLVDDEIHQVTLLRAGLSKLPDCHIATATSGAEALALCAQQPFDLLITDYLMPEMDGLTLARRVHAAYPGMGIIMLTAHAGEILDQGAAYPVQLVLEKPIDIKHIRAAALNTLAARP